MTFSFPFEPKLARKGKEIVTKSIKEEEVTWREERVEALKVVLNIFLIKTISHFVDFICLKINCANFLKI